MNVTNTLAQTCYKSPVSRGTGSLPRNSRALILKALKEPKTVGDLRAIAPLGFVYAILEDLLSEGRIWEVDRAAYQRVEFATSKYSEHKDRNEKILDRVKEALSRTEPKTIQELAIAANCSYRYCNIIVDRLLKEKIAVCIGKRGPSRAGYQPRTFVLRSNQLPERIPSLEESLLDLLKKDGPATVRMLTLKIGCSDVMTYQLIYKLIRQGKVECAGYKAPTGKGKRKGSAPKIFRLREDYEAIAS